MALSEFIYLTIRFPHSVEFKSRFQHLSSIRPSHFSSLRWKMIVLQVYINIIEKKKRNSLAMIANFLPRKAWLIKTHPFRIRVMKVSRKVETTSVISLKNIFTQNPTYTRETNLIHYIKNISPSNSYSLNVYPMKEKRALRCYKNNMRQCRIFTQ